MCIATSQLKPLQGIATQQRTAKTLAELSLHMAVESSREQREGRGGEREVCNSCVYPVTNKEQDLLEANK